MFEIGFWELVMVGVVALIVVGPERLPGLARTAGLWLGKARRIFAEVKAEVDRELHLEELKQTLRQQAELNPMKDLNEQIHSIRQDLQAEFDNPGPESGQRPAQTNAAQPADQIPPPNSGPAASPSPSGPVQLQKLDSTSTMPFPMPPSVATAPPPEPATPVAPPQPPQPPTAN